MNNGKPVLVCDLFSDSDVTRRLKTDVGVFTMPDFIVGQGRECFSPQTSRTILLQTNKDCSQIKEVEFV